MKYIIVEVALFPEGSLKIPFIFPNLLVHKDMLSVVQHNLAMNHGWFNTSVYSAGFINFTEANCHGESTSLNVRSREGDWGIINLSDYGGIS